VWRRKPPKNLYVHQFIMCIFQWGSRLSSASRTFFEDESSLSRCRNFVTSANHASVLHRSRLLSASRTCFEPPLSCRRNSVTSACKCSYIVPWPSFPLCYCCCRWLQSLLLSPRITSSGQCSTGKTTTQLRWV